MKIIECEQGSSEWFEARKGVPTASRFGMVLTAKTMRLSAQADELINQLIGEKLSLIPPEGVEHFTNRAIRWGEQTEDEARAWYSLETNHDVQQVGFCLTDDGRFGCSPDGLIGDDGVLELKCPQAATQVSYLLAGGLPSEYRAQCAGALIVTGRPWLHFVSYSPGLPPLLVKVQRDEYVEKLAAALEEFHIRYQDALERITSMGGGRGE